MPKYAMIALAALCGAASAPAIAQTEATRLIARTPGLPYAPKNLPDRIVLTPGTDPSREMAVAFRTDTAQTVAQAQIAVSVDGPTLAEKAWTVTGTTTALNSANGPALYHQVRFTGLESDSVYVYRVKGAAGWSEWHQFRTAAAAAKPFRFLYLGDIQNGILTYASRVIRQAFHAHGDIRLTVHAGDLVSQRDQLDHDDEWGEWNQAGGYNYAMVPQLPAAGNHEYIDRTQADGNRRPELGPYWPAQFALPANGAEGDAKGTTYYVDYQGVRFIILDGTSGISLGTMKAQTDWLDATLASSKASWNVILFHQPVFTCARPRDTSAVKKAWQPVFERHDVDLVLQGHDHCYSRLTAEAGHEASAKARADGGVQGPVYLVSVTGSKMYALNDRSPWQPDKVAEATELYQIVDVEPARLVFRTYTASGALYDGFDLERREDGRKFLKELDEPTLTTRRCTGKVGPDGGACVASSR